MTVLIREEWTPTQEDFSLFAEVSGDDNPIHVDPEFSARTRFGRTVSHGMLLYSKLWALARKARPQDRHMAQSLMFPNPTYVGEVIVLEVAAGRSDRTLSIVARRKADGAIVLQGETEIET